MKQIAIIGTGMDGRETLTEEARGQIAQADCLIGAKRMLEPFLEWGKPVLTSYDPAGIAEFIGSSEKEKFAVLTSGDCGFYSAAQSLLSVLGETAQIRLISGIASPVYFCNCLKIPWQDVKFVSLHGKSGNAARAAAANRRCFFLLGGNIGAAQVCARLTEYGLGEITAYVGEELGRPNERIVSGTARELSGKEFGGLSVLLTENPDYERAVRSGIPDSEFIRGSVPMTKSEIRALAAAKLEVGKNSVVWDIGSGTGSISVEAALKCEDGTVWAVDAKPEAAELTRKNAVKFHCDNIRVIEGSAPECLEALPNPDRVFLGGTGGRMAEILSAAFAKNPKTTAVAAAVSLESVFDAVSAFAAVGIGSPEIVQAAAARARRVGTHTMLHAENPVFLIKGVGE